MTTLGDLPPLTPGLHLPDLSADPQNLLSPAFGWNPPGRESGVVSGVWDVGRLSPQIPANRQSADKLDGKAQPLNVRRGFGQTRWTLVLRAGDSASPESRRALEELCRAYRQPLRDFAGCLERDPQRADDLVQDFLTRLVEKNVVAKADPARGRFRNFLRAGLYTHMKAMRSKEGAQRRKGSHVDAELNEVPNNMPSADRLYFKKWAWVLLDRSLARLNEEQVRAGNGPFFEALRDRLEGGEGSTTLREAALRLGTSEGALKVRLFGLRRRFRELAEAEAAETVEDPEDARAELQHLLAVLRDDP